MTGAKWTYAEPDWSWVVFQLGSVIVVAFCAAVLGKLAGDAVGAALFGPRESVGGE